MSKTEMTAGIELERSIQSIRAQPDESEKFSKVLDKTIYEKARDKMKEGKKKSEDETTQKKERSFLDPFLKKLNIKEGTAIEEETAINIKNEALRSLKDRLLTRAEIIQRRLEEEQKNLETAYMELRRKGDNISAQDEAAYEKAVAKANFRMDILTERAQQHYKNSLDKFTQLDKMLMEEPMLSALRQPPQN